MERSPILSPSIALKQMLTGNFIESKSQKIDIGNHVEINVEFLDLVPEQRKVSVQNSLLFSLI